MINVPIAQALRFRPISYTLPNFDNTFNCVNGFQQYFKPESIQIQVVCSDDRYSELYIVTGATETQVLDISFDTIGAVKYATFIVDLSTLSENVKYRLKVYDVTYVGTIRTADYLSEPFYIENNAELFKVQWFNSENNFMMSYTSGLVHTIFLEFKLWKLQMGGESSIYINQGEEVKLKEIVKRTFLVEMFIPDYLCEQLILAMAHDRFYINDIEYVTSKKPTITQLGTSNMYSFAGEVTQKMIVGLNTHDIV